KPPWRGRKEAYIAHIREASASARLVSAADKLHNARSILSDYRQVGEDLWDRFTGKKEGTLWYYGALLDAFRETGTKPAIVDELDRTITELNRLAGGSR
nr:phosphohydrolase [Rubrobacter sp.]